MPHLIDHDATGNVTPSEHLEEHNPLCLVSSLSTVINIAIGYQIGNFSELPYTTTGFFRVPTSEQLKYI